MSWDRQSRIILNYSSCTLDDTLYSNELNTNNDVGASKSAEELLPNQMFTGPDKNMMITITSTRPELYAWFSLDASLGPDWSTLSETDSAAINLYNASLSASPLRPLREF